jgi:ABC-type hemin transport system ATPase subunit
VLHDLNQALASFDRLWLVQDGRLVADLPADRSALVPLERLFGIRLRCIDGDDGRVAVLVRRGAPAATGTALAA